MEGRGQFLSLREAYLSNLSLLPSLEPLEKFVVVGGGGWWWCLNVKLVIGFGPSLGLGLKLRAKPINMVVA